MVTSKTKKLEKTGGFWD